MKKNLKLSAKIILLCLGIIIVFGYLNLRTLGEQRNAMIEAKNENTKKVVETAVYVAESFLNQYKAKQLDEKTAKSLAMEALRGIRFQNGDYVWINDTSPQMLMHPQGKDVQPGWYVPGGVFDYTTADGKKLFQEFNKIALSSGEGFINYKWIKSGKAGDKAEPKVSFIKYVKEWDWIIGTGTYTDDVQKEISAAITGIFAALVLIVIISLSAAFFLSRSITRPVIETIKSLSGGADQVYVASGQIAAASQDLAQGASEQAASIEETASSLEEITSMIANNTENTKKASAEAISAKSIADSGINAMNKMASSIIEIKKASDETVKIIKTIDEIAFQTNLLALNAAVEAARAGETGKGFAVVAEEVRSLAKRSAEAAKTTGEIIANSLKNVENGVKSSEEVKMILAEVASSVAKVSALSGEISAASEEQAKGIKQINSAVGEMDKVTQRNSANAEESASASEELSSQSAELNDMVVTLANVIGENDIIEKAKAEEKNRLELAAKRKTGPVYKEALKINIPHTQMQAAAKINKTPVETRPQAKINKPLTLSKPIIKSVMPAEDPRKIIPFDGDEDLKDF